MLTSNDTPADEFQKAIELGAIINLDDISHIEYLAQHAGMPQCLSFRYNPGNLIEGNDIIGKPTEAKYGVTYDQIFDAYKMAQAKGVKRFGSIPWLFPTSVAPRFYLYSQAYVQSGCGN